MTEPQPQRQPQSGVLDRPVALFVRTGDAGRRLAEAAGFAPEPVENAEELVAALADTEPALIVVGDDAPEVDAALAALPLARRLRVFVVRLAAETTTGDGAAAWYTDADLVVSPDEVDRSATNRTLRASRAAALRLRAALAPSFDSAWTS